MHKLQSLQTILKQNGKGWMTNSRQGWQSTHGFSGQSFVYLEVRNTTPQPSLRNSSSSALSSAPGYTSGSSWARHQNQSRETEPADLLRTKKSQKPRQLRIIYILILLFRHFGHRSI